MARKEPEPPHELDPLKGGLKHSPFAALRGKVEGRELPSRAAAKPAAPSSAKPATAPGRITVRIERTGRGGKTVTIADGPGLHGPPLEPLAREIARGMGTGARVENSTIVVQGDQRERLVAWLGKHGFGGAVAGN
ncbi:MAG: translation initiation factor [Planctomycetes bacterium]|nr:translation initiation factor [Planctomycetota bacterium]